MRCLTCGKIIKFPTPKTKELQKCGNCRGIKGGYYAWKTWKGSVINNS